MRCVCVCGVCEVHSVVGGVYCELGGVNWALLCCYEEL